MALPTFTPPRPPSPGTRNRPQVKLLKAEFGDGYTQTAGDGLNNVRKVVSLQWNDLLPAEAQSICAFFEARRGAERFWWTLSDETTPVKWTCEDTRENNGFRTIAATFTEQFDLGT